MDDRERNELTAQGHEPIEADVRAVWRTGAAIAGVVLATFGLIFGMMKWLERGEGSSASDEAAITDLDRSRQNSLDQLRSDEKKQLDGYGWIDREGEVARIPLDRAIEIISDNGLPPSLPAPAESDSTPAERSAAPGNSPANIGGPGR